MLLRCFFFVWFILTTIHAQAPWFQRGTGGGARGPFAPRGQGSGNAFGRGAANGNAFGRGAANGNAFGRGAANGNAFGRGAANGNAFGRGAANGNPFGRGAANANAFGRGAANGNAFGRFGNTGGNMFGRGGNFANAFGRGGNNGNPLGNLFGGRGNQNPLGGLGNLMERGLGGGINGLFGTEADPKGRSPKGSCPNAPTYNPCIEKGEANRRVRTCCQNLGLPNRCIPFCNLDLSRAQLIVLTTTGVCAPDGTDANLKKFMKCVSGGNDVTPCCSAKGVPSPCSQFCNPDAGMPALKNPLDQIKCLMTFSNVRNCYWGYMN